MGFLTGLLCQYSKFLKVVKVPRIFVPLLSRNNSYLAHRTIPHNFTTQVIKILKSYFSFD